MRVMFVRLMTLICLSVLMCFGCFGAGAHAQHFLAELEGHWVSTDEAFGGPAVTHLRVSPMFNGQIHHLDYQINRENEGALTAIFSGVAHYKSQTEDTYSAYWADSNGDLLAISARVEDRTLIAQWGSAETKLGRTHYQLREDGLSVTDFIWRSEDWQQFNQLSFTRDDGPVLD